MQILTIWILSFLSIPQTIEISTSSDFFEIDQLGNLYVVLGSEISKYDSSGKRICNFSDLTIGNISSIDVSDPLRILLFYRDFNQIVYLNNKLSQIGSVIDLYDFSDNETELISNSHKGGFWIYNSIENQIFRISNLGIKSGESILLGSFFDEAKIVKIVEYNSNLFLLYANKGILQLDQNGQFARKLPLPNIQDFQIFENKIYYQTKKGLYQHQYLSQSDRLIYSNEKSLKKTIRCNNGKIFINNEKSIAIKSLISNSK
ncbi:hypothetical protein [Marinifilum sp.]|uniref:hypothetical protein n=1 Tax=Marinifilum sp. TaxID=2033137 RepID=UPI003BA9980B